MLPPLLLRCIPVNRGMPSSEELPMSVMHQLSLRLTVNTIRTIKAYTDIIVCNIAVPLTRRILSDYGQTRQLESDAFSLPLVPVGTIPTTCTQAGLPVFGTEHLFAVMGRIFFNFCGSCLRTKGGRSRFVSHFGNAATSQTPEEKSEWPYGDSVVKSTDCSAQKRAFVSLQAFCFRRCCNPGKGNETGGALPSTLTLVLSFLPSGTRNYNITNKRDLLEDRHLWQWISTITPRAVAACGDLKIVPDTPAWRFRSRRT